MKPEGGPFEGRKEMNIVGARGQERIMRRVNLSNVQ